MGELTEHLTIRRACWGDYEALITLLAGYRADEIESLLRRGQDSAGDRSGGVYIMDAESRPAIGTATLLPWLRHAEISSVAVMPVYRRQGLGRALLRYVIAEASRARYPSVELTCALDNHPALRLYTGLGFRVERTITVDGAPHVVMRLML